MPSESVKVMVRVRPQNKKEIEKGCKSIVLTDQKLNQICLQSLDSNESQKVFTFDNVFPPEELQQNIYEASAFGLVENVVEGYNGTIFAYGQTGCGKTFTMLGDPNSEQFKGIIPRTFSHIVNVVQASTDKQFLLRCSYIEIYNEEIRDLLGKDNKAKLELKESPDKGVFIKDLNMVIVKTAEEMDKYMTLGTNSRAVAETNMNSVSSRSHCIFSLYIECSMTDEKGNERFTAGKLNLVDLAGSERQSKTGATGDRLKEATKINLSLSALGNVISALVDGKSQHIPYRDSKLTRLLQDSLGGNTKTIMIAAVSPADYNYDETLSTLRYASRAKNIKNQPKVNEDPKDALLKEYAEEIKKLKELLQRQKAGETIQLSDVPQQLQKQATLEMQHNHENEINSISHSQELHQLKQQMEDQLKQKELDILNEKLEKEKIENMMKELQQKMVTGGQGDEQSKKKYDSIKQKMKKQQKEHDKLLEENKKKEEEMLSMQHQYNSLQEEVEEMRKIIKELQKKYKSALDEIKDLEKEHEFQRQDFLDTIRLQEKDFKLYLGMCQIILTEQEIEIIKGASDWNEDKKEFKIPPFYFKDKQVKFPKMNMGYQNALNIVDKEKENREIDLKSHRFPSQQVQQNQLPQQPHSSAQLKQLKNQQPNDDPDDEYTESLDHMDDLQPQLRKTGNRFMIRQTNNTKQQKYNSQSVDSSMQMNSAIREANDTRIQELKLLNQSKQKFASQQPPNNKPQEEKQKVINVQLEPIQHSDLIKGQKALNGIQNGANNNNIFNDKQKIPKATSLVQLQPLNVQPSKIMDQNSIFNDLDNQKKPNKLKLESIQTSQIIRKNSVKTQHPNTHLAKPGPLEPFSPNPGSSQQILIHN